MRTVQIDHITVNENGTVEVGYHLDGEQPNVNSRLYSSYQSMLDEAANPISANEEGLKLAMAAWVGIDPTGGNTGLLTEFRTEIDFTALVSVRRILNT